MGTVNMFNHRLTPYFSLFTVNSLLPNHIGLMVVAILKNSVWMSHKAERQGLKEIHKM